MEIIGITFCEGKGLPRIPVSERLASQQNGIEGDRFGQSKRRQVSIVSIESWNKACNEVGVKLDWLCRRVNLLVQNHEFSEADIGKFLQIGNCVLEVMCECTPCYKMNRHAEGLEDALKPAFRGGICCRVISDGVIREGDDITWHERHPEDLQIELL